jgi:hypothetical protein
MKNGQIFSKTLPFVWLKMLSRLTVWSAMGAYAALVLLVFSFLGFLSAGSTGLSVGVVIGFIVVLLIGFGIYRFIGSWLDYMIKAGHVAVITELTDKGNISTDDKMLDYGFGKVKQRFVSANVFFALDKLIAAAVRQIQNGISAVANWLSFIPGIKQVAGLIGMLIGIVLNYVDEAVLAHVFRSGTQNAFRSSCDGIVLYFQNWKVILKNAAIIVIITIIYWIGGGLALGFGLVGLFSALLGQGAVAVFLGVLSAMLLLSAIKSAFIDSYILITVINKYTIATTGQTPGVDIYEKARKISAKFRKLEYKAGTSQVSTDTNPDNTASPTNSAPTNSPSNSAGADVTMSSGDAATVTQTTTTSQTIQTGNGVVDHTVKTLRGTRFSPIVNLNNPIGTVGHIVKTDLINQGLGALNRGIDNMASKKDLNNASPPPNGTTPPNSTEDVDNTQGVQNG